MSWIAYEMPPIDLGWEYLLTVEAFAAQLAKDEAESEIRGHSSPPYSFQSLLKQFKEAQEVASEAGWEGDFKQYAMPRIFFIPDETQFAYGFVWKQPNNGTTYVVSRYKLPWL